MLLQVLMKMIHHELEIGDTGESESTKEREALLRMHYRLVGDATPDKMRNDKTESRLFAEMMKFKVSGRYKPLHTVTSQR